MNILAIETSCDETAISILEKTNSTHNVIAENIASQVDLHAQWGGVVPNLAAREHTKNIIPLLKKTLIEAKYTKKNIDLIAVTHGPGLIPALISGVTTAKSLSYMWQKPLIGVHHISGHIYANWITNMHISFPLLSLIISGGHTQIVFMKNHCEYEIIGQTHDDAVGEAFDKVARMLGLGYPGGPIIAQRAQKFQRQNKLNTIIFPQPMRHKNNFDFSFSGIKTAVLYHINTFKKNHNLTQNDPLPDEYINAVADAFQTAVTSILIFKTIKAAKKYNPKTISLAGGVSANIYLRENLHQSIIKNIPDANYAIPSLKYCGDNATMIAMSAYYMYQKLSPSQQKKLIHTWKFITAKANRALH